MQQVRMAAVRHGTSRLLRTSSWLGTNQQRSDVSPGYHDFPAKTPPPPRPGTGHQGEKWHSVAKPELGIAQTSWRLLSEGAS